jgi:hypothetical protein
LAPKGRQILAQGLEGVWERGAVSFASLGLPHTLSPWEAVPLDSYGWRIKRMVYTQGKAISLIRPAVLGLKGRQKASPTALPPFQG